jgi:hypothetical protein
MADEPRPTARARPLLVIATGSSLRAEELDRPLAYYLLHQVERLLAESHPGAGYKAVVLSDLRWIRDDPLQDLPTLSVGGPGVNGLAQRWLEELPISLAVDNEYYIQMDPDLDDLRASVWGMDNATTQIAVFSFVQRFLPRYLDRCIAAAEDEDDVDDDSDDDDDSPDHDDD